MIAVGDDLFTLCSRFLLCLCALGLPGYLGAVIQRRGALLVRVSDVGEARKMLMRVLMVVWFAAVVAVALLPQPTGVSWV